MKAFTKVSNAVEFTLNKEDHTLGNTLRMCAATHSYGVAVQPHNPAPHRTAEQAHRLLSATDRCKPLFVAANSSKTLEFFLPGTRCHIVSRLACFTCGLRPRKLRRALESPARAPARSAALEHLIRLRIQTKPETTPMDVFHDAVNALILEVDKMSDQFADQVEEHKRQQDANADMGI